MAKLDVGSRAPGFALDDQDGNRVSREDFLGRKMLIYFYPRAKTPGCTKQSCAVRDALGELTEQGVAVVGISPDPPQRQKAFDETYSLGFPLLSDCECEAADAYGVRRMKAVFGRSALGIVRSAFLVDEEGTILNTWYGVSPGDTVPNVRQALAGG